MPDELRRTVESIPGLACSARPDGAFELLNERWCAYTGLAPEQARGTGWHAAIHPDDLPALAGFWRALPADGEPGETEARLRRADGAYRWFLFRAVPQRGAGGRVERWYGQATDIDDRRRARALLAGEKRLLEMIAWGCALPVVLEALCGLVEETASDCHCCVLLLDPAGGAFHAGVAPTLPAALFDAIDGLPLVPYPGPCAMAAREKTQVVVPDVAAETRWAGGGWHAAALALGLRSCWTTPILSLAGEVLGTFAIYQPRPGHPTPLQLELTGRFTHVASIAIERAHGEAALRRSEAFLAEAQRLSSTGSFSWKPATGEIVWSEQTYRIYGLDPASPVTMELARGRVHPEDHALFQETVAFAHREGTDLAFEHRLRMPDGSVKHLRIVARALRHGEGAVEYVGAVQDVTERRRADDALDRVRSELAHVARIAALGELTASIAHEVNQPLAGIVTNAGTSLRMLAGRPPDVEGAMEAARRTIRDANRAAEVIARLRTLFGRRDGAREPVDLNDAAREVIALSWGELQRAGVLVRAQLADGLPPVSGDRVQLQQVVLNLLLNAAESMREVDGRPRRLTLATAVDGDGRVRLSVRDAGVGVDGGSTDRLFDPFFSTRPGGMGMGLAISRSIVERHDGRLWATPNDGPGATFAFSLPTADPGPEAGDARIG